MLVLADPVEIPERVIEDDQDIGLLIQRHQQFGEPAIVRLGGELGKSRHPLRGAGAGQVVNAEMEVLLRGLVAGVGRRPFDRNGNVAGAGHGAKKQRRLNVVVVRQRYQRGKVELFDLPAFQIEGQLWCQGRRPVTASPIDRNFVILVRTALQALQQRADELELVAPIGHKVQGFLGLIGMAVERDASLEGTRRAGIAPQVRDRRSGHFGPPVRSLSRKFCGQYGPKPINML